jgi:hypothetical protein
MAFGGAADLSHPRLGRTYEENDYADSRREWEGRHGWLLREVIEMHLLQLAVAIMAYTRRRGASETFQSCYDG